MQLTLLPDCRITREPLKGQLLKWIGNKQKFADQIIKHFPEKFNTYFEPFIGSGSILATLAPSKAIASDTFVPLVEIWSTLKGNPELLIEWYRNRYKLLLQVGKEIAYEKIKASYNKKPNGADLLFLSRTCYGGVVRFRMADGYMSTPCGIHDPISPISFTERVNKWHFRIKRTSFEAMDYTEAFSLAKAGDLIYCDPPYKDSQSILYGAQTFELKRLYSEIEHAKSKGTKVALSIDGTKKSGKKTVELEIPQDLFKREIRILNGRSMLKRFQMEGKTLENEVVTERLLLTY